MIACITNNNPPTTDPPDTHPTLSNIRSNTHPNIMSLRHIHPTQTPDTTDTHPKITTPHHSHWSDQTQPPTPITRATTKPHTNSGPFLPPQSLLLPISPEIVTPSSCATLPLSNIFTPFPTPHPIPPTDSTVQLGPPHIHPQPTKIV